MKVTLILLCAVAIAFVAMGKNEEMSDESLAEAMRALDESDLSPGKSYYFRFHALE